MTTIKGDYFKVEKKLTTIEECQIIKKGFYACVIDKKNEMTKTLPNDQWKNYLNQFDIVQLNCAADTQVKNCSHYFSFYDINY